MDGPEGAQERLDPTVGVPVRGTGSATQIPRHRRVEDLRPTRGFPRLLAVTTTGSAAVAEAPDGADGTVDAEVDAAREERARAEARARLRRGRLITAVVVGVLVLVVGVVALLGGLRPRTDLLTPVTAGAVITSGPYEVTLEHATVQHRVSDAVWEVVVSGSARTTGATSIDPPVGEDSGFVYAKDRGSGEVQASKSIMLGGTTYSDSLAALTPGLPAVPWTVTFDFQRAPGDEMLFVVFDQEYTNPYIFGDEMGWRPTNHASTLTLPLEKLADDTY